MKQFEVQPVQIEQEVQVILIELAEVRSDQFLLVLAGAGIAVSGLSSQNSLEMQVLEKYLRIRF